MAEKAKNEVDEPQFIEHACDAKVGAVERIDDQSLTGQEDSVVDEEAPEMTDNTPETRVKVLKKIEFQLAISCLSQWLWYLYVHLMVASGE